MCEGEEGRSENGWASSGTACREGWTGPYSPRSNDPGVAGRQKEASVRYYKEKFQALCSDAVSQVHPIGGFTIQVNCSSTWSTRSRLYLLTTDCCTGIKHPESVHVNHVNWYIVSQVPEIFVKEVKSVDKEGHVFADGWKHLNSALTG